MLTEIFRLRRADLAFPSRAAKQGRGNESVSGGDREPRLTEPQRDSCRRSRRMRCSAAARLCRQMLHFASLTEILSLRYRLSVFLSPQKEKLRKRKTAQGTAPRSEPRFAPANRDLVESRGSMRLRPPRPPGERAGWERQPTEMLCTAEKVSVFGAKPVCSASRAARPQPWLPLEGKLSAPAD